MSKSKIAWCDETWNPLSGCKAISPGCLNCFAVRDSNRLAGNPNEKISSRYRGTVEKRHGVNRFTGRVFMHEDVLERPRRWRKPRLVFVCSMSDLFNDAVPFGFIDKVFATMEVARRRSGSTFQVLTKRAARMRDYLEDIETRPRVRRIATDILRERSAFDVDQFFLPWPLPNVWLGVSVEDNKGSRARRAYDLIHTLAARRFISYEPALEWVSFPHSDQGIDQIIIGGESGPRARFFDHKMIPPFIRNCRRAGVLPFVKQLGSNCGLELKSPHGSEPSEWPEEYRVQEMPEVYCRA